MMSYMFRTASSGEERRDEEDAWRHVLSALGKKHNQASANQK